MTSLPASVDPIVKPERVDNYEVGVKTSWLHDRLLDLRIGARTSDGKYDAFLWSHNATNTKYYMVLGAATPFSGLTYGIPGDPLTFGLIARVRL